MQNRVLLVEDDDELRELLARYLTNQGFTVREAANGRDGLALALGQDCDIVVLDIMLPDISGLEVLRELRAETHLPVVLLTARGDETDRIVGFEVGADDYIPKPCNPRELVARFCGGLPGTRKPKSMRPGPMATSVSSRAIAEFTRMMWRWS
jgi:two-component system response regulator CpxR